jgi:hypothetical protein
MTVNMKTIAFWDAILRSLVQMYVFEESVVSIFRAEHLRRRHQVSPKFWYYSTILYGVI